MNRYGTEKGVTLHLSFTWMKYPDKTTNVLFYGIIDGVPIEYDE